MAPLAVAQLVNLSAVLLVVRIYPPTAFGHFATLFAIATVVAGISSLRLDIAITTAAEPDVSMLIGIARRLNMSVGGAAAVVGLVWLLASDRLDPVRATEMVALGGAVALLGLINTLSYACVRAQRYALLAASRLSTAVVLTMGQVGLGLVWPSAAALLVASAAGYGAGVLLQWRLFLPPAVGSLRGALRRHRGFMVASTPASLMNNLALNLPVLVAATAAGSAAAADLALALRIGLVPLALVGQALMPILFGEIARQLRSAPAAALGSYDHALSRLSVLGACCLTGLSLAVYATAPRALGEEWVGAGAMLLILTPFMIAQFAVAPLSQTLNALGRNRDQLLWDAARLVGITLAFVPVLAGWTDLRTGVALFSGVMVVAYAVHILVTRKALRGRRASVEQAHRPEAVPAGRI